MGKITIGGGKSAAAAAAAARKKGRGQRRGRRNRAKTDRCCCCCCCCCFLCGGGGAGRRSFGTCASTGGYVFVYAILFFSTKLDLADFVSGALYFGYMGIISSLFGLVTGTIGFEACFWFNRKIFGAIKVD